MMFRLTRNLDCVVRDLAQRNGMTQMEVIRTALGMIAIADEERAKGNTMAIVRERDGGIELVAKVVGY